MEFTPCPDAPTILRICGTLPKTNLSVSKRHQLLAPNSYRLLLAVGFVCNSKRWNNEPAMMDLNVVLQIHPPLAPCRSICGLRVDARTRFVGKIQTLRLVME